MHFRLRGLPLRVLQYMILHVDTIINNITFINYWPNLNPYSLSPSLYQYQPTRPCLSLATAKRRTHSTWWPNRLSIALYQDGLKVVVFAFEQKSKQFILLRSCMQETATMMCESNKCLRLYHAYDHLKQVRTYNIHSRSNCWYGFFGMYTLYSYRMLQ